MGRTLFLAMGLNASKGKKTAIDKIYPRHFYEHDNHDRQRLDSSLVYTGAHNVYYVKSCLSDAKCFSGSRYSFRVQELKPLLFHNWPVHGEIAWLFPAPC